MRRKSAEPAFVSEPQDPHGAPAIHPGRPHGLAGLALPFPPDPQPLDRRAWPARRLCVAAGGAIPAAGRRARPVGARICRLQRDHPAQGGGPAAGGLGRSAGAQDRRHQHHRGPARRQHARLQQRRARLPPEPDRSAARLACRCRSGAGAGCGRWCARGRGQPGRGRCTRDPHLQPFTGQGTGTRAGSGRPGAGHPLGTAQRGAGGCRADGEHHQPGHVGSAAAGCVAGPVAAAALVSDLVYVPMETPLLAAARARGNPVVGGLGMLLHQARPAFHAWFGVMPQVGAALRSRIEATL
jgi:hypothetical protein